MNLVVLGANGRTGQHVVQLGLERGFAVTAVVRSNDKMPNVLHCRLNVEVGDPSDPRFLRGVFAGKDAVISTLGGRRPSRSATAIYYTSAAAIVEAAQVTGLNRVVVISTALLFPPRTFLERILPKLVRHTVRSARRMEAILTGSPLAWTIARCGFLNNDAVDGYRCGRGYLPQDGTSVARLGLAQFLIDALGDRTMHCRVYGVSRPEVEAEKG